MVTRQSAIEPSELNFSQQNNFTPFIIDRLPDLQFVMTELNMPDLSLGSATIPNPQMPYEIPGNIEFSDLTLTFLVDENFANYNYIVDWMLELGYNEPRNKEIRDEVSDGSFSILDNNNNLVQIIRFVDCYPVSLSGPQFSSKDGSTQITSEMTLKFTSFSFEN